MAREERSKEDLFIKETKRSKNLFVTSSARMDSDVDKTSTTISSSVFDTMKANFDAGDFLLDDNLISINLKNTKAVKGMLLEGIRIYSRENTESKNTLKQMI